MIGGTAVDDGQVIAVGWSNNRGVSGGATGTDTWVADVVLQTGRNNITVTATDKSGNTGAAVIAVYSQASSQ
jgi:hypothetical protein